MKYKVKDVRQTQLKSWFVLEGNDHWEIIAKRSPSGICRTRFDVYQDGELQYTFMQKSRLKQLLEVVPIVRFFYYNPFYFFRDGVCCGSWKVIRKCIPRQWDFIFDGVTYRFSPGKGASQNHVFKNGEKFADYQFLGRGNFEVDCSEDAANSPDLVLLFAAYAQIYLGDEMIWC